ncbi:MAG: tRNA uridine-5-carboxymethylaminomethyl(34) synthesis enzyme MnmG, partial [Lentisphaeria bacterium]
EIAAARQALQTIRHQGATLWELLRQPERRLSQLPGAPAVSARAAEQLEIEARYEIYRRREDALAEDLQRLEEWPVPDGFDFAAVPSLGTEALAKLVKRRPANLAQAARIDGITPADIALLQVRLHRQG